MICPPLAWHVLPGCCQGTPDELFMDTANGEMDVSCVLSNADVSSLFFIIMRKGKRLPLSTLDLHNSKLTSSGIRRIAKFLESSSRLKELRELNLSNSLSEELDRSACHALTSALILQAKLQTLNLSHLRLTHTHVSILCPAFALPIEVLDLSGNKINNSGALRLFRLRPPNLRELYLHNNDIKRDVLLQAHPLVKDMPHLTHLSVFSLENDLEIFTDPQEAEKLLQLRETRLAEEQRVMHRLQGYQFLRPTLDDDWLLCKELKGFSAETGECDFGPQVPDKPSITSVIPLTELPEEQAVHGCRCIAEYHTGTGNSLAYALCEVHEPFPDLQVRFSSRVVNPHNPGVPEGRAFNRLRRLTLMNSPDSSPAHEPPPGVSVPSFSTGPGLEPPKAQTLTGKLFQCPSHCQVSFAEKEARKLLDPDVRFQNLVQLVQLWGVPLERPACAPTTASKQSGAPPLLVA